MIYEYHCEKCDKNYEINHSMNDAGVKEFKCEDCGGILKRQYNQCPSYKYVGDWSEANGGRTINLGGGMQLRNTGQKIYGNEFHPSNIDVKKKKKKLF